MEGITECSPATSESLSRPVRRRDKITSAAQKNKEDVMTQKKAKGISRRDFIKTTGAGLAAAGLSGADLAIPRPSRNHK